jgi:hypothetical protein
MSHPLARRERSSNLALRRFDWGVIYDGTREQLLSSGIFDTSWFPGEPGMGKVTAHVRTPSGRHISIYKRTPRRFHARWRFTGEELGSIDSGDRQCIDPTQPSAIAIYRDLVARIASSCEEQGS